MPPEGCIDLADGRCVLETFVNPPLLEPNADGVYELEMVPTEFTFAGQRHCLRAYNGNYVAPTIETPARVGDAPRQVRVNYLQSIDGRDCACFDLENGESCEPVGGHGPGHSCHCEDEQGRIATSSTSISRICTPMAPPSGRTMRPGVAVSKAMGCAAGVVVQTETPSLRNASSATTCSARSGPAMASSTAGTSTKTGPTTRDLSAWRLRVTTFPVPGTQPRRRRMPTHKNAKSLDDRVSALELR